MEDWKPIKVQHFVTLDESKPYVLLVPRSFYSRVLAESLIDYHIEVKPIESKDLLPRCIFDLKANISAKLIADSSELSTKVMAFNRNMVKYLRNKSNFKDE
jgi:hypothetical protein